MIKERLVAPSSNNAKNPSLPFLRTHIDDIELLLWRTYHHANSLRGYCVLLKVEDNYFIHDLIMDEIERYWPSPLLVERPKCLPEIIENFSGTSEQGMLLVGPESTQLKFWLG